MDLSNVFNTMDYEFLIAKLGAYGFQQDALVSMKKYFMNRQQRVRVNSNFSTLKKKGIQNRREPLKYPKLETLSFRVKSIYCYRLLSVREVGRKPTIGYVSYSII